jgi:hypothetical protein
MVPQFLSELVGRPGVFGAVSELRGLKGAQADQIRSCLDKHNATPSHEMFDALRKGGILGQLGDQYFISSLGETIWLLLSAINGTSLTTVVHQLAQVHAGIRPYELVTEGMTAAFINDLENRPDFRSIYICSPWVHLKEQSKRRLMYALYKAQKIQGGEGKIEIIVIARPLRKEQSGYEAFKETFSVLQKLGAEIVVNPSVHAKLYIRAPGPQGGLNIAVVGSENLTSNRNIELGIQITNDNSIIQKLISYYFQVYARCKPIDLGG